MVAGNELLVGHDTVEQFVPLRFGKRRVNIDHGVLIWFLTNRAGTFVVSLNTISCSLLNATWNAVWPGVWPGAAIEWMLGMIDLVMTVP